ncbi:MAG TPA: peptidoglycan-binding protein [Myxococcales bacterium]
MRIQTRLAALPTASPQSSPSLRTSKPATSGAPVDVFESADVVSRPSAGGPTLQAGDSGDDVVRMQRLLAQAGFAPGAADGDFGPATASAVKSFQRKAGLAADGVCGPMTWAALENGVAETPNVTPTAPAGEVELRTRILALAQAEVGTTEATGNNDGPVLKYPEFFGRGSEPYCADFVSWVCTQAGKPLDFCYVPSLRGHLEETGQWKGTSNPQPGDIVIFDFEREGEGDHVGIVKAVLPDGSLETIEGNTGADDRLSDSGSLESGVWNRVRSRDDVLGFASP